MACSGCEKRRQILAEALRAAAAGRVKSAGRKVGEAVATLRRVPAQTRPVQRRPQG